MFSNGAGGGMEEGKKKYDVHMRETIELVANTGMVDQALRLGG